MTAARLRALILALLLCGIITAGFFGLRFFRAFREFPGSYRPPPPAAQDNKYVETDVELIRDWMTVPYIAETYGVSPAFLFKALGIPPRGNEEKSLAQLNEEFSPGAPGIVMEVIRAAILAQQSASTEAASPARKTPLATP